MGQALISLVFDGLCYGMLLFIIAVGLSITMGLMGFINLAHGAFAMAGGYATVSLTQTLGVPFLPALALAFLLVGGASILFERMLYARLYDASELDQVLLERDSHIDTGFYRFPITIRRTAVFRFEAGDGI